MNKGISYTPLHQLNMVKTSIGGLFKRTFDIVVSLIVLILLSPFLGLIALAIKQDSPGPVIYRGRRIGRGGKSFKILKFRTMYENPKSYAGPKVTAHDDSRITNLGRWLRDTKINELPQFWNVLCGDMSLVGPRPEDPDIAHTWPQEAYLEILSVRPGITSPASVQYHNEESLLSMENVLQTYVDKVGPDKIRLDQLYVRYRSFWLDLDVLLWTVFVLLPKFNSSGLPEGLLFLGPITRLVRRYLNWFSVDLLTTSLAFILASLVWNNSRPLNLGIPNTIIAIIEYSLLFSLAGALFGVNHISWSKATIADAFDLLAPWMAALLAALIINSVQQMFPTLLLLAAFGLALYGYILSRYRSRIIHILLGKLIRMRGISQAARERVIIVGTNTTAQLVAWLLNHPMNAFKFHIAGFVDENLLNQGLRMYGSRVLGTYKDIPRLIQQHSIGVVIMTGQDGSPQVYARIEDLCKDTSVKLLLIPDMLTSLGNFIRTENEVENTFGNNPARSGRKLSPLEIPITGNNVVDIPSNTNPCAYCLSRYAPANSEPKVPELNPNFPAGDVMTAKDRAERKKTGELKPRPAPKYTGELRLPVAKPSGEYGKPTGPNNGTSHE